MRAALLSLVGVGLVASACATSTAGRPLRASLGDGLPFSSSAATTTPPPPAATTSTPSTPSSTSAAPQTAIKTVTIQGAGNTNGTYVMSLWATDDVSDCAAHSYGQIVTYFQQHPCRAATRYLWTLPYVGRTAAVSIVCLVAADNPGGADPYLYREKFVTLEKANGTGSIDDLIREGKRIPGTAGRIPSDEVFGVFDEDAQACVMDAWYTTGTTNPQDSDLRSLESDLFKSDATIVNNI